MRNQSDDCASGIHDFCARCECECHGYEFSIEEILTLWRILKFQYISYEDESAQAVCSRILSIVREREKDELGREHSPST